MGNASSDTLRLTLVDDKEEAFRLLQEAEKHDFYIEECRDDSRNAAARKGLSYSVQRVTPEEKHYYQAHLDDVLKRLPLRLTRDLGEVRIVPLMPSADGGMPHTRPKSLLCFSNLKQLISDNTLTHELWHVHQRAYQEGWKRVFGEIGWTEWQGQLPVELEKVRRFNPDTIDSPLWIYQNTWVPVPVFRDVSSPKMRDVDIWFYRPSQGDRMKEIPAALGRYFPKLPSAAYEHPRELAAYLLADPYEYGDSPGFQDLSRVMMQFKSS